jgi:phosphoenolpyruvate-protein kinase (PTS system EI component)
MLSEIYDTLGTPAADRLPLGLMVEVPSAVETLDLLAPYVDFVSLGTNDLTQYILATDRGNAKLSHLYDPLHPALVRLYGRVAEDSARHRLDLSVCGELAGDPLGVAVLLGLGYRKLSVSPAALPEIRELIRNVSVSDLRALVQGLGRVEDGRGIREPVRRYLVETGAAPDAAGSGLSKE